MSRLMFGTKGMLRAVQMSQYNVFAFVEGDECDPVVFGGIVESCTRDSPWSYQVRQAREVSSTGGKPGLLEYYKKLRKVKSGFSGEFNGKKYLLIFFFDKDIDDVLRKKVKSKHAIYTEHYDIEFHLFWDADLSRGLQLATGFDPEAFLAVIPDARVWLVTLMNLWEEWIALCLLSEMEKAHCGYGYSRPSCVNQTPCTSADLTKVNAAIYAISIKAGLPEPQVRKRYDQLLKMVRKSFRAGQHGRLFKGKWLFSLVEFAIRASPKLARGGNGLGERLRGSLLMSLLSDLNWAENYKRAVRDHLSML